MKKIKTIAHPLFDNMGVYPILDENNKKSKALKHFEKIKKKEYKRTHSK